MYVFYDLERLNCQFEPSMLNHQRPLVMRLH
jgi:hypothetical protein